MGVLVERVLFYRLFGRKKEKSVRARASQFGGLFRDLK